jgi:carbonic anhydrase
VSQTTVMRDAWIRGQDVAVHGWIYSLRDGRLRDLRVSAASPAEAARAHAEAVHPRVQQA